MITPIYDNKQARNNLSRRIIISKYTVIKKSNPRSIYHIIKILAEELGYKLDVNGSNSYLMKVIRDHIRTKV